MASQVQEPKKRKPGRQSESGQIALEYVLIMLACVAIAFLLSEVFASRKPDAPGFLIERWYKLSVAIGADEMD